MNLPRHSRCTDVWPLRPMELSGKKSGGWNRRPPGPFRTSSESTFRTIRTVTNDPNESTDPNDVPTEREACSPAPEIELAGREREASVLLRVLQIAEVAQIASEADMVGHEAHCAEAEVHAPVVAVNAEQLFGIFDVRLHQPQAATDVRPEARAGLAAHGNAEDDVCHQVLNVVAIREADVVGVVLEECRCVRPVRFESNDAGTHPAKRCTVGELVVRWCISTEAAPDVRREQPVGAGARRSDDQQHRRYQCALL